MAGARLMDVERVLFAVGEGADCRGTAVRDARVCTLSEAGFAGFFWIFRMGEDRLYERWTADAGALVRALDESLRAFTRDHECLRVFTCFGWIGWSRICRIYWDFQDGGGPADAGGLVRALDERSRAFASVYECWADCLKQDLQDFLGFSGWRGSRRHWCAGTSVGREIASVYERS